MIEHHLRIYPDATPIRHKPRKQSVERQNFIREEVRKLLHADFIEEIHHPEWLANPVVVPKAKGNQAQHKLEFTQNNPVLNLLRAQTIQHTVDVGYYAPAARTTLNPLCSSCSCIEIGLILANPRVLTLWV